MSIKKSLQILLIISSIIPVMLVSVIAHGFLSNKLIAIQTENLHEVAETNRIGLEAMLESQKAQVSLLAIQSSMQNLALLSNQKKSVDPSLANELLNNRQKSQINCVNLSLVNLNNEIIASSDPNNIGQNCTSLLSLRYIAATGNIAVGLDGNSSNQQNGQAIYTFDIGCPVKNPGSKKLVGFIISTVNTTYFKELLSSISIGDTGFGMILDKEGRIIYHPNSSYITSTVSSEKLSSLVTDYKSGLLTSSGTFELFFENTNQVYAYSIIPELNWVLLVKQDISEIRSYTNIMLSLLLFVCAILFVIIIIFANSLSRHYSAPIIALRDAMRIASDGDLTVQSNIKSNNELGELSKNFNKMLHIIKTNYEDLASMHEELLSNEEQLRSNYDHIEFLAYHDVLTNLPNKLAFLDYVNAALMTSPVDQRIHAVYFIDLDNFKTVNDTLGHEYGDELLVKTSQILTSIIGESGMLARAGGDEFLIFKENISTKEAAIEFAAQLTEAFRYPLYINGEAIYVSMSVGISLYPENGLSPNALIKNADIAMYKSKDTGKNKYTMFDAKMEEELNRNTLIVEVLRSAIDNNEIYIQYQPLIELSTNMVIGFEALMRIRSDRIGFLKPNEFIPVAEESGLIVELSSWLIKEACRFNKSLIDRGFVPRPVSVNVSSVQINRPGFVNMLSEILNDTGLPPEYLELEITESTLVSSIMDATELLTKLQKLGVKVSLDDFGTGYSSLNYLTRLPINTLKIDKSFIDNIHINHKDSCIAQSIIQLAHSLNIKVVAEGVEQESQLQLLKNQKCDIIQGFIFSKPLHPDEFVDVVSVV